MDAAAELNAWRVPPKRINRIVRIFVENPSAVERVEPPEWKTQKKICKIRRRQNLADGARPRKNVNSVGAKPRTSHLKRAI